MQILKTRLQRVIFGGGPLSKQVGDALHAQGIFLDNLYGMYVMHYYLKDCLSPAIIGPRLVF